MSQLFSPLTLRGLTLKNRVFVSPMCQYSAPRGLATPWHLVHLGSRAVGGAALVMVEASAVSPAGRISAGDMGIWSDAHADALAPIAAFISEQGASPGIQLSHAGRKGATLPPWRGGGPIGRQAGAGDEPWPTIAPSAVAFAEGYEAPQEMSGADIDQVVADFAAAARRAAAAGFEVVELHLAHGYLLHQFLSPLSNLRGDEHGGDFEGRARLPLRVAAAVRAAFPERLPVFARLSVTDWVAGGWDLPQSIRLARALGALGIDFIDCSSGGVVPGATIPVGPGYQVAFSQAIRREAGVPTGAVGLITSPEQAETIVATGQADAVLLARELLRDPYWPLRAAQALGAKVSWPVQYDRARRG
jgi:2,4-dienoyl-CoA reductase-like NADH-dependent reductase (Old Yellow Enzyme family)